MTWSLQGCWLAWVRRLGKQLRKPYLGRLARPLWPKDTTDCLLPRLCARRHCAPSHRVTRLQICPHGWQRCTVCPWIHRGSNDATSLDRPCCCKGALPYAAAEAALAPASGERAGEVRETGEQRCTAHGALSRACWPPRNVRGAAVSGASHFPARLRRIMPSR